MNSYNELIKLYRPITAYPFQRSRSYTEIMPGNAMKPYIRCFWGTDEAASADGTEKMPRLIIPDTCMDIIFRFDRDNVLIDSGFCTIDERPYYSNNNGMLSSVFAIRFHPWAVTLFTGSPLTDSRNKAFAAEEFFPKLQKELPEMLMATDSLTRRAAIAEKYLSANIRTEHINSNMMNAVHDIIASGGTVRTSELAEKNAVSTRQLERIFNFNMGISPKNFSSLVRYQMLWQEMCFRDANILDLVEKYGYSDQSHLLNDFKKRHSMSPKQALAFTKA